MNVAGRWHLRCHSPRGTSARPTGSSSIKLNHLPVAYRSSPSGIDGSVTPARAARRRAVRIAKHRIGNAVPAMDRTRRCPRSAHRSAAARCLGRYANVIRNWSRRVDQLRDSRRSAARLPNDRWRLPQTQSTINSAKGISVATSVPWEYANSSIALPPLRAPAGAVGVALATKKVE